MTNYYDSSNMSWLFSYKSAFFINYSRLIQIMKNLFIFEKFNFLSSSWFTFILMSKYLPLIFLFFFPISSIFEVNHSSFPFFYLFCCFLKQCMGSSFLTFTCRLLKLLFLTWNEISVFELLDKFWQCIHINFLLFDYFLLSFWLHRKWISETHP